MDNEEILKVLKNIENRLKILEYNIPQCNCSEHINGWGDDCPITWRCPVHGRQGY